MRSVTAATSQKLADALRAAGFETLAKRAETNEFHDFFSPSDRADPSIALDQELVHLIQTETGARKIAAINLRSRHHNGDFDASKEESDEWAASPDGQDAFGRLARGE
jgi:hypothetical protein